LTAARPTVYLHIGAMKTGTTFLQKFMFANQDNLGAAGVLVAGDSTHEQALAVRDILHGPTIADPEIRAKCEGRWGSLRGEMLAHRGPSLFSMEFLSFANHERAARVVGSLRDADVHVVLTVRDARRALPAQWQTLCRNGGTLPWAQFLRAAERVIQDGSSARGAGARAFQRTQGIPRMIQTWAPLVPAGHLHVITVPPPGSDPGELWRRFASVVGVAPEVATTTTTTVNPSIGQASAELMRRVNVRLQRRGEVRMTDYARVMKVHVARALAARADSEERAVLDRGTMRTAGDWNSQVHQAAEAAGAHVVGSRDDLPTAFPADLLAAAPVELTTPRRREILGAAAAARDALLNLREVYRAELGEPRGASRDDAGPHRGDPPTRPSRWREQRPPVTAAVDEVTELVAHALELRRRVIDRRTASLP